MAHTCPDCGCLCHCNGDIDDLDFGEDINCRHFLQSDCDGFENDDEDDWDDDDEYYD